MWKPTILIISTLIILSVLTITVWGGISDKQTADATKTTDIYILAAASLSNVIGTIEEKYEKSHPGIDLVISTAASGKLQQQIEQGVPADLFLSAGIEQMDALESKDLLAARTSLLSNELILITSKEKSINGFKDLTASTVENISIGHPGTVPAGHYAKQVLISKNLWEKLHSKIVFANDVRQVTAYVETGNVAAGIVYRTDAVNADQIKTVKRINGNLHSPIVYPMGIIKETNHLPEAKDLYQWLQGSKAAEIFEAYGFNTTS